MDMLDIIWQVLVEVWRVLGQMSPYLLFGFLIAGILSVFIRPELVEKHLGSGGVSSIFKASLFGVPLPLCSCGVIPVSAGLRRQGASRGAVVSFLISTPQTGIDSILVTYGMMGGIFAIFRPIMAFVSGIIGGIITSVFERLFKLPAVGTAYSCSANASSKGPNLPINGAEIGSCCSGHFVDPGGDSCCKTDYSTRDHNHRIEHSADHKTAYIKEGLDTKKIVDRFIAALKYGFITLLSDIARPLLVGIILAGLISAIVPEDYFARYLNSRFISMLVMMLVGLPIYVCATASVPIAAMLILKGVSPGAAFVFLMTGPATNAATITVIAHMLGKRLVAVYIATVVVLAFIGGYTIDWIFDQSGYTPVVGVARMLPEWVTFGSSIILIALLAYSLSDRLRDFVDNRVISKLVYRVGLRGRSGADSESESIKDAVGAVKTIEIYVDGMSCKHCEDTVRRVIQEKSNRFEGIKIDVESGQILARADADIDSIISELSSLGYRVVRTNIL